MFFRHGVVALAITFPLAIAYADTSGDSNQPMGQQQQMQPGLQQAQKQATAESALIKTPPNSTLLGTSIVDEIRSFPEMSKGKKGAVVEKVVGVEGIDRVFQTDRPFADTVSSFDMQFKQPGFQTLARVETPSAIAWTIKRPDGTVANAVVRNTKPTTFEIAEASVAAATLRHQ